MEYLNKKINEQILIYPFIAIILLYIAFYGVFITHGFAESKLNLWFLVIFIPIILIDCFKTVLECSATTSFYDNSLKEVDNKKVTVIIPTKDGGTTLAATLEDLLKKFKPRQIIVASNGSTDNTCEIAKKYKVRLLNIEKPIGKIDAINEALALVKTEFCLTMDDDVLIGNATISTELLKNASGVAFRVLPKIENWVTKIQAHEYRKSMDVGKNFHNSTATVQNISGAIGLFRTKELIRQINFHTGEFSGEDLQRTLLIHLNKEDNRVVLSQSVVETEVPNTLWSLYKQRVFGWGPGLLSNTKNLFKILIKKNTHLKLRYEAFYTLFLVLIMDPLRLIALPILVWYPTITIIVYLFYVLLELIPYIKLSRKEPLWVVFITPIYGLFNFLARITGSLVFLYRRIAVFIARKPRLDDYRTVTLGYRLSSLIIASFIFASLITLVTFIAKPIVSSTLFQTLLTLSFIL
jgi:glycosyltransferase involved in cell wall biosynthesis